MSIIDAKKMHEKGLFIEAADIYGKILGPVPELAHVFLMIAEDAIKNKQQDAALLICERIEFNAINNPDTLKKVSGLYEQLKVFDKASEINKAITALTPKDPIAWRNLGATLNKSRKFEAAQRAIYKAIDLSPGDAIAHSYLSAIFRERGRLENAFNCAEKAISINPSYAEGHVLLSELLLSKGKLKEGFKEYEWRLKLDEVYVPARNINAPYWDGSKLDGTLLVAGEQGYGDVIQMCRYVALAAKQVKSLILMVHAPLVSLLESIPDIKVISFNQILDG